MNDSQFEEMIGVLRSIADKLDKVIKYQAEMTQGETLSGLHSKLDDVVNAIQSSGN
ncbi:hypothetical protein [uncultured Mucilaginibacter sp.]|uniref:hypothetical protein n=1 Tax=uncultured Mucilaginibacter sp. TaxID=797541 RepID=UPI0025F906ED|nr:hypothetical protein [uncultured Mucilaginibacter sp.]